ncbi:hypothetical protein FGO68_gene97 [Halteria grandinella]|uniref:Uncharacterized protein n=1 Tax=Halteria grandinella TaxID=5974 RepID=A0A8J8NRC0_HALGN|nr:hypothetical protein FGO68_gene97 [Halteria grandinella]
MQTQFFSITKNTVNLEDSYIQNSFSRRNQAEKFVTVQPIYNTLSERDVYTYGDENKLYFILSDEEIHIKRTSYTLFDAFASTGGFFSGLQENLFFSSLINRLCPCKYPIKEAFSKTAGTQINESLNQTVKEVDSSLASFDSHHHQDENFEKLLKLLLSLKRVVFSKVVVISYSLRSMFRLNLRSQQKIFQTAKQHVERTLEVDEVLSKMKKVDILEHVILSHLQREFVKYIGYEKIDSGGLCCIGDSPISDSIQLQDDIQKFSEDSKNSHVTKQILQILLKFPEQSNVLENLKLSDFD